MNVVLVGLLAWGALSFGAVYPWTYWPLAAGCAAFGLWAIVSSGPWRDPRTLGLAIALASVAGAIGLQLVPLPVRALTWLSPAVTGYFSHYEVGYQPPSFLPLTISASLTWTALGLFCALSLLLLGLVRALRTIPIESVVNGLMGL